LKRTICLILAVVITLLISACTATQDDYMSGISFDPMDYDSGAYTRYENKLYGIILEYPESFARVGNFDLDGYITFEKGGVIISVYVPDTENNDILTAEEYVDEVLNLSGDEGSGTTKYGKCSGYKTILRDDEKTTIDFVIKGIDAFYRFAYSSNDEDFSEDDYVFQSVMSSIRIDDGVYNKLNRMSSRYTVLLEYATSMQYITDANYANHCLNNYAQSNEERHKIDALNTSKLIRDEIGKILTHERDEGEGYDSLWEEIIEDAKKVEDACFRAEKCVQDGDYEGAQKIARTEFLYDLSEHASKFIATINAEISEY